MYKEPSWAKTPVIRSWKLLEIKGGVQISDHAIGEKSCSVLGRAVDMVHIPIHHESASRQHARIAFDCQGTCWLRDLQSTHGTTCNKRPLPSAAIGKVESNSNKPGSRGVMLFPGDVLQFGASTRRFVVEGPPEFDRGAIKAKMQQQKAQQQPTSFSSTGADPTHQTEEKEKIEVVSWGLDMDDHIEESDTSDFHKSIAMDAQVPEKHRNALEKLNALKYKLSNLEREDERIRRKGELTEGQERQLAKNFEREEQVRRSISEREAELYDKLHPEKATSRTRTFAKATEDDELEDDSEFYDRTKHQDVSVIEDGDSEKTLVIKWKSLQEVLVLSSMKLIPQTKKVIAEYKSKLVKHEADGGEEGFFVRNDLQLAEEHLAKLLTEEAKTVEKIAEVEKLLQIVNPKLHMDRETGNVGESVVVVETRQDGMCMLPPPNRLTQSKDESSSSTKEEFSMPPPINRKRSSSEEEAASSTSPRMLPPQTKRRVIGPTLPRAQPQPTQSVQGESTYDFVLPQPRGQE